jgi:hypothetical protein
VNSGVPQGSNLGPLFFILYINDLPTTVKHSRCLLYADDINLYKETNNEEDVTKLQEDINMVYNWDVDIDLGFHIKKCHFLVLTSTKLTQKPVHTINGEKLERAESIKDLSVIIYFVICLSMYILQI